MTGNTRSVVIGVDLGGSKILSAAVDSHGKIIASDYRPTHARTGIKAVIHALVESVRIAREKSGVPSSEIEAIGLGAPGISNPETGIVFRSPNLPEWHNVPVRDLLAQETGKKVFLINDANAAALGELYYGEAKECRNFIYVTISTGIGGGIVIDRKLYTGTAGMAGEVGHITVEPNGPPCNCGGAGCWELYASGSGMARRAREKILAGRQTALLELAHNSLENIDAPLIKKAADQGDMFALELIAETARYLGIGLGSLINIFNPELIIIGGGLSGMGDSLLQPAFEEAGRRSYQDAYKLVRFAVSQLGGNAGVLGAAIYARLELKKTAKVD